MPEEPREQPEDMPEEGQILRFPSTKEESTPSNEQPEGIDESAEDNDNSHDEPDIIRPDFSKKKKGLIPSNRLLKRPRLGNWFFAILPAPEGVDSTQWREASQRANGEMVPYLQSLNYQMSRRTYHDTFAIISGLSNEQILEEILNSSESDWKKRPTYYRVLTEEMMLRAKNPHKT